MKHAFLSTFQLDLPLKLPMSSQNDTWYFSVKAFLLSLFVNVMGPLSSFQKTSSRKISTISQYYGKLYSLSIISISSMMILLASSPAYILESSLSCPVPFPPPVSPCFLSSTVRWGSTVRAAGLCTKNRSNEVTCILPFSMPQIWAICRDVYIMASIFSARIHAPYVVLTTLSRQPRHCWIWECC